MATITQQRDAYRNVIVSITGVLQASNSPVFHSFGYSISSFTAQGSFATSTQPTVSLQGSNDGGATWFSIGGAIAIATPTGSLIGTNNEVFQLYRFNVTGGDAGTNLSFFVFLSSTFG
jgi:hypothetical protein